MHRSTSAVVMAGVVLHSGFGAGPNAAAVAHAGLHASVESPARAIRFDAVPGVREITDRLLVRPAPGVGLAAFASRGLEVRRRFDDLGLIALGLTPGSDAEAIAGALLEEGLVSAVTMDYLVHPINGPGNGNGQNGNGSGGGDGPGVGGDPYTPQQWHLDRMKAHDAWAFSTGSPSVTMAFVDSGVDLDHPDLQANLVPGFNAPSNLPQVAGGAVQDLTGHGTATAGAAAAIGNNLIGGAGVGWSFGVMPIRATNQSNGAAFLSDILSGITWALNNGADVVSVSYAGVQDPFINNIGSFAKANYGALLVWGIDDTGQFQNFDHPDVIVVASVRQNDTRPAFSSFGPGVDFAAPGVGLFLPHSDGDYRAVSGNSYATPLVAAAAALVWSINPSLTPNQVEAILVASAEDIGPPGEDHDSGHGVIDLGDAAEEALESLGGPIGFLDPVEGIDRVVPGLLAAYYNLPVGADALPDFAGLTRYEDGAIQALDLISDPVFAGSERAGDFAAAFAGFVLAPADRLYTFIADADDGVRIRIGDTLVIDDPGLADGQPAQGTIGLKAGLHPLSVEFFSVGDTSELRVTWQSPTSAPQVLSAGAIVFSPATADYDTDGDVDISDFSAFVNDWALGLPSTDLNGDGVIDITDFSVFLTAWALRI